jgi:hypothetical protein
MIHSVYNFRPRTAAADARNLVTVITNRDLLCVTRNFKYANWDDNITFLLNYDFYQLFQDIGPVGSAIQKYYGFLNTCLDQFVPCKSTVSSSKWQRIKYPCSLQRFLGKRPQFNWHVYRTFKTQASLETYKDMAFKCKSTITK